MNDPQAIRDLLADADTWFVVGLADNPTRAAWEVADFLQRQGKRIVPVHPRAETVFGEPGYPTVAAAAAAVGAPDVVDVFVNSAGAGQIADDAIAVGARAVWFQLGVVDEDAARRVEDAGLVMVMNRCPKLDWPRD